MNNSTDTIAAPYGPVGVAALLLVVGFLAAIGFVAWRQGSAFQVPTRDILAVFIVLTFTGVMSLMFIFKLEQTYDIMIGALIVAFSAVIALYFRKD